MRSEIKIEINQIIYIILSSVSDIVALSCCYYLIKRRDKIGKGIEIEKEQRKKEGKKRLGKGRRLQNL